MATEFDPPYELHQHFPKDVNMPLYNEENPHPEHGKNPNIKNIQGHTEYPKFVYPKGKEPADEKAPTAGELSARQLASNPKEEMEITGKKLGKDAEKGW